MSTQARTTALLPAAGRPPAGHPAPVEYAVAVDLYLGQAALSAASRRVYLISLASWAWPLVGRTVPAGAQRRNAAPPVVPLALLDDAGCPGRLAAARAARAAAADARTVNRELSALRSAIGWWREQGWIATDPLDGLRHVTPDALGRPLSPEQAGQVLRLPASLREHALWRLLHDSGAPAADVLGLDADQLDLSRHRARPRGGDRLAPPLEWHEPTSQVLRWLLAGRTGGPVFLTERRAPADRAPAAPADRVPAGPAARAPADTWRPTGQARMSYRRAAEIFSARTRPLDPAGRGWSLHQLSAASARQR